ncbi:hypothetical protein [Aurantiacibacter gangjinensis]|uniref:Uncharacterized protein n=1 Tax=Aurantiacibacter gangjinensis TaxID=502682 RepID=A0A0G9MLD5_9SPHN|nr:hypothetical protein [Aurantiacibacter gangjinensis]APE27446.1 hypothetical protein BMF35_a0617 [Aurantiacibacter gangjinensis]KLE31515.1 hypothetical protein AAW01_08070 [Aurantiacibacter gangjinensis]
MKLARGPRPWSIRLFAILFLASALIRFVDGLLDPTTMIVDLFRWLPNITITQDIAVVALNAQFTIALIPVALIWFRASRIARILIGVMVGVRLLALSELVAAWQQWGALDPVEPIMLALSAAALAQLFTPSANRWIALKGRREADAFE